MLCQLCNKNTATTVLTTSINGHNTTRHICSECAAKSGVGQMLNNFSFGNMMSSLLQQQIGNDKRCPTCGSYFEEIRQSGKIGCSECYGYFYSELAPTIQNIHGKANHVGKRPHSFRKEISESARNISLLDELKEKMQKAITDQDFEAAAKYRDEIKNIEGQQG